MEDNYFDKKLKDILENLPPFEPDARAIADMKRRLETIPSKNRQSVLGFWWLIPLLILPFLFGGIFFYLKYQNINQKLDEVTLQLKHFQKDTIIQNHITFHYDTIYNLIYKDVVVNRHFEKVNPSPLALLSSYQNTPFLNNPSRIPLLTDFSPVKRNSVLYQKPDEYLRLGANNSFSHKKQLSKHNDREAITDLTKGPLESIGYPALKNVQSYTQSVDLDKKLNVPEWNYRKPKVNPIYYFMPKGINVGGNVMPFVNGKANSTGYSGRNFGVRGALEFYHGVELQFGLEHLGIGFELEEQASFANYPILPPDNSGDLLKELYVDLNYLQVPISLKKYFRNKKDLKPFFSIGIVAQKPLKQKFRYEYEDSSQNDYGLRQSLSEGAFSVNNFRANIGVLYHFWKHFSVQTEVAYQHSFEQGSGEYFQLKYWGLNMGVNYHFN